MSITVKWDNRSNTIIRYQFKGNWTWEEFTQARTQAQALKAELPYHISIILDMRRAKDMPEDILVQARRILSQRSLDKHQIIIVGDNKRIIAAFRMFCKLFRNDALHILHVQKLAQAREILKIKPDQQLSTSMLKPSMQINGNA